MKYSGYDCPVCGEKFTEGQDVVVCPVCGAPHHRECYRQNGGCGLEANHEKGIAWEDFVGAAGAERQTAQQPKEEQYSGGSVRRCPGCGSVNPADGIFCQVCGTMMGRSAPQGQQGGYRQSGTYRQSNPFGQQPPGPNPVNWIYGGLNPEDKLGSATAKEVAAYVGPASNFYLSRFGLSARNGNRNMSFCWSGFLFGFMYFFYRKVYRVAIPLLIAFLFSLIPNFLYSYEYMREMVAQYGTLVMPLPVLTSSTLDVLAMISNVCQTAQFVLSALMGFLGHKLYLQDIDRKIAALRQENIPTDRYIQSLSREGGVSSTVPIIVGVVLVLGYFAGVAAMVLSLNLIP